MSEERLPPLAKDATMIVAALGAAFAGAFWLADELPLLPMQAKLLLSFAICVLLMILVGYARSRGLRAERSLVIAENTTHSLRSRIDELERMVAPETWAARRALKVLCATVGGNAAIIWPSAELDVQVPLTFVNRSPHSLQVLNLDLELSLWDEAGDIHKWAHQAIVSWPKIAPGEETYQPIPMKIMWPCGSRRLGQRVGVKVSGEVVLEGPWAENKRYVVNSCAFLASRDERPT